VAKAQDREITSSERIKRITDILRLDGREVELHLPLYIEIAKVLSTTQDHFVVRISNPLIDFERDKVQEVYINFIFSGAELFGKCRFIEQAAAYITLAYPESLQSRTKRRYPRIRPRKSVTADIKFKEVPASTMKKISSRELPVKFSQLYWEAQRDNVDLKKVFLMGVREIKSISPHLDLVIYNKDTSATRDARILRKSGKALFIDDCSMVQSYTKIIPSDNLISYSYYINEKRLAGASQTELTDELRAIIDQDFEAGYTSKVLVPIFSREEVIGHIRVCMKEENRGLTADNVNDIIIVSSLLTTAIENARFVPNLEDIMKSVLVDISEGGMLLKIVNPDNAFNIPEGTEIEVKFLINRKDLNLRGNILRKGKRGDSYAVKFTNLSPDEKRLIKRFIHDSIEGIDEKG
jgi:hypothetical protein